MCNEVLHVADVKVAFAIKVAVSSVCAVNVRHHSSILHDLTLEVVFRLALFAAIPYLVECSHPRFVVTEFNSAIDLVGQGSEECVPESVSVWVPRY